MDELYRNIFLAFACIFATTLLMLSSLIACLQVHWGTVEPILLLEWLKAKVSNLENAMNDPNIEYSNEFKEQMNDSNASFAHSPERMSDG